MSFSTYTSGLDIAYGITFDNSKNLYIADAGGSNIIKVDTLGNQSIFASDFNYTENVVFDNTGFPNGYLYVMDSTNTIYKVDVNGNKTIFITNLNSHYFGMVFDSNNHYFYVNGVLKETFSLVGGGFSPVYFTGIVLGYERAGSSYFDGLIDDVKVWNRSITPNEIKSIYKSGLPKTSKYNFQKVLGIPTYTFERITPQSILDLPFYIKSGGAGSSKIKLYQDGLYGKRYNGFCDDILGSVNWFATATQTTSSDFTGYSGDGTPYLYHGVEEATVDFSNFSSSFGSSEQLGYEQPDEGFNQYSWQWTGYFKAPYTDNFTFKVCSDDSGYLWIGNNAISGFSAANANINHGGTHGGDCVSSDPIALVGGQYYPIRIQFGEQDGGDFISVSYSSSVETDVSNFQGRFFHLTDSPVKNGSSPYNAGDSAYQIKTDFPSSTDGLYWIKNVNVNNGEAFQIYADMTTLGGGWTLIAMNNDGSNSNWTYQNAILRNQLTPPSDPDNRNGNNYSIIAWADYIKKSSSGFQYMIDADERRSGGGIWTANGNYSFVNNNNTQTDITINTKFGNWVYDDEGIEAIMPWYSNNSGYITTSHDAGGQYWGTLISNGWSPGVAPWIANGIGGARDPRAIWYWVR